MFAYQRTLARRRVIVTLTTGRIFEGVVWAKRGPWVVLRDAHLIEGGRPVPIDGECVLDVSLIEFTQLPPQRMP